MYAAVGAATMPEASRKAADGLEPVSISPCASLTSCRAVSAAFDVAVADDRKSVWMRSERIVGGLGLRFECVGYVA